MDLFQILLKYSLNTLKGRPFVPMSLWKTQQGLNISLCFSKRFLPSPIPPSSPFLLLVPLAVLPLPLCLLSEHKCWS